MESPHRYTSGDQVIPDHTAYALLRYVDEHLSPGHFLTAVLSNDLTQAIARADSENIDALGAIVDWLYWEVPSNIWGSPEKVAAHLTAGRTSQDPHRASRA